MKWKRNSEKLENNMKETIPKCANQLNPSQCPTKIIQMTIRLKCIMVSIDSKLFAGAPVAFKTWCGHQYGGGHNVPPWLR